jgi:hypothetical protein
MKNAHDALHPLADELSAFARDHATDPLYAHLAAVAAQRPAVLALLLAAPPTQRRATLLLAAIQDRLLALREADVPMPALAGYYPSLGGTRAADEALAPALEDFVAAEADTLRATIARHTTQTNEVGRCAVLWPALSAIARAPHGRPLALFDFGCSAGLNLSVDDLHIRYRHRAGHLLSTVGAVDADAPRIDCRVLGPVPPLHAWTLAARLGVDRQPVSLDDAGAVRWLRACLWPSERERASRFEQALHRARVRRHPVQASDDGVAVLSDWLKTLPAGVTPVLFNSWVLAYFSPAELAAHTERVTGLIREHGLVWLSAEDGPRLRATTGLVPPAAPIGAAGTPTWWSLSQRSATGAVQHRLLACSHPHGDWLAWAE